jgi:sugar phosphate isomerase/epimerase
MLPRSISVVGPDADHSEMKRYVETAFARAEELGGQMVVFGSGGSRNVPDGWSREEAIRQFDDACAVAGEAAARHGITIAIEPLNRAETNLVNSVSEAAEIVERVEHPSVKLLSDLYHVAQESESLDDTGAAASVLAHVHVAEPGSRVMPHAGDMDAVYRDYFSVLQRAGYDQRISIESRNTTVEKAADGLSFLRQVWADVASDLPL